MSGNEDAKKPAHGGGQLPLDLPHTLQFLILARIPIYELRRLLIDEVSPEFSAAIRRVLGEIAMEVLRLTLKGDKHWGSKDADHVRQESKGNTCTGRRRASGWRAPTLICTAAGGTGRCPLPFQSGALGGSTETRSTAPG
jgi:hypothetical protein